MIKNQFYPDIKNPHIGFQCNFLAIVNLYMCHNSSTCFHNTTIIKCIFISNLLCYQLNTMKVTIMEINPSSRASLTLPVEVSGSRLIMTDMQIYILYFNQSVFVCVGLFTYCGAKWHATNDPRSGVSAAEKMTFRKRW